MHTVVTLAASDALQIAVNGLLVFIAGASLKAVHEMCKSVTGAHRILLRIEKNMHSQRRMLAKLVQETAYANGVSVDVKDVYREERNDDE